MHRLDIPGTLPPTPSHRLRAAGCSMYGGRWQSGLAKALKVDRSTIVRWNNGAVELPDDINERLAKAFRVRAAEMIEDAGKMVRLAVYLEAGK